MKRIPTPIVLLLALALAGGSASAANIAWVSFHPADNTPNANAATASFTNAPDIGYTALLRTNGHNVTRFVTVEGIDTALLSDGITPVSLARVNPSAMQVCAAHGVALAWFNRLEFAHDPPTALRQPRFCQRQNIAFICRQKQIQR